MRKRYGALFFTHLASRSFASRRQTVPPPAHFNLPFSKKLCLTGKIRLGSAHKAYNKSMITLNDIHLRLCECIRESGYTQTHLAELLGISPSTVSHYLRGDKFPALDTLANLCRILDVSPAYILCFE